MTDEQRAKLLQRKAAIEGRLKRLDAKERTRNRRADARRKIIAGALALEHAQIDPEFGAALARLLNRFVTRPQDRALFSLPERGGEPANDFQAVAGKESKGA